MIETSAVSSVIASRSRSGETMPLASSGRTVVRQPRLASALKVLRTASCSMPDVMRCRAPGHLERLGRAANREVIGLGAAAGEDDFRRFGADEGGNGAPRVVDCGLCLLPVVMNTRRIAEKILEGAHHGIGGRRIDRGRRVVIEVNAHVLIRMLAHGRLALTHSKIRARHVWDGHLY